jgi:hypothetical protein
VAGELFASQPTDVCMSLCMYGLLSLIRTHDYGFTSKIQQRVVVNPGLGPDRRQQIHYSLVAMGCP